MSIATIRLVDYDEYSTTDISSADSAIRLSSTATRSVHTLSGPLA